ncbi:MAG: Lysophospholipase, partial [Actinomycetota bacterium]|nr:Lysophospholipase [Actinomycetota bacterium]
MTAEHRDTPGIDHTSGEFIGVGGTTIYYQEWSSAEDPVRAVVLIVHGIAEHSGRYEALAADLVRAGFAVGALDHRGHGRSGGKRVQVARFDDLVDDLATFADLMRERYPSPMPMFVLGHSMGGLVSLRYLIRDRPEVAGLVLSGAAAAKPEDISGFTIAVGNLLAKVAPDVGVASLQLDKISRDPQVVIDYNHDPLVTKAKVRARMGSQVLWAMEVTEQALPTLTVPILIMHGGDDVVTPPDGSRMIAEKVGSTDKTLKIYDGLWHEIYNEPERDA